MSHSFIDPMSVAICTPSYDGKTVVPYTMGLTLLAAHKRFAMPYMPSYCSNAALARNMCVHWFLESPYQHLVFIDADMGFSLTDWEYLMEGDEEAALAEYRKKDQVHKVRVLYGLGFARISRRLLEEMAALERDGGGDMLMRFRMDGEEWIDYFPQGVVASDTWRGEDHGFWLMARLTGLPIRIERRPELLHTGTAHWKYHAADFPAELSAFADPDSAVGPLVMPDPTEI